MHCKAMFEVGLADTNECQVRGFEKPICHVDDKRPFLF